MIANNSTEQLCLAARCRTCRDTVSHRHGDGLLFSFVRPLALERLVINSRWKVLPVNVDAYFFQSPLIVTATDTEIVGCKSHGRT